MSYSIVYTEEARLQLLRIMDWISKRSTNGAAKWLDALEDAELRLKTDPEGFSFALEADDAGLPIKDMIFKTKRGKPYRLLYLIKDHQIEVISVRGPGQSDFRR